MANEKLKIISINANFCNNFNFWLLLNFNDPHDHLHWFYHQLHKAETKKQKVFVLGHIAPGTHSCLGKKLFRNGQNTQIAPILSTISKYILANQYEYFPKHVKVEGIVRFVICHVLLYTNYIL